MPAKMITAAAAGLMLALTSGAMASAEMARADKTVTVGGAPMSTNKTIVENAAASKDHTTLVAAVKAAGLVETLAGSGPFTVFAPTNAAFEKLPDGAVAGLLRPESKGALTGVLTYHVVPGRMTAQDLVAKVEAGGGKAMLKTAQGEALTVSKQGSDLLVWDAKGGSAKVTIADVGQSNGVIHVIDKVLMP